MQNPLRWFRLSHWRAMDGAARSRLAGGAMAFAGLIFGKETVIWVWNKTLDALAATVPAGGAAMTFPWTDAAGLVLFAAGASLIVSSYWKPTHQEAIAPPKPDSAQDDLSAKIGAVAKSLEDLKASQKLTALRSIEVLKAQYALNEMLRLKPRILRLGKLLERAAAADEHFDWENWGARYRAYMNSVDHFARLSADWHDALVNMLKQIPTDIYRQQGWNLNPEYFPGDTLHMFKTFRYYSTHFEQYADDAIGFVRIKASV
jgi:hypothetical protein